MAHNAGDSAEQELNKADPPPVEVDALEQESRELGVKKKRSDLQLGERVAYGALLIMLLQIAVADFAFYKYCYANDWKIPVAAINGWLAATVVQVVAVVLVITRYLFPPGGPRD